MSELNTPRLMAAAKEFNIGANTLIDYLISLNLSGSSDLKPTSKLTPEMYGALLSRFDLEKYEKLNYGNNINLALRVIENVKVKKLNYLDLGNFGLKDSDFEIGSELDIEIRKCDHIEFLILSTNWKDYSSSETLSFLKTEKNESPNLLKQLPNVIKSLKNLTTLIACGQEIMDISILGDLKKLKMLILHNNYISSLGSLINTTTLNYLDVSFNLLENLEGLDNNKLLKSIYAVRNNINDISALRNIKGLETINFSRNFLFTLYGIEHTDKLTRLIVNENNLLELEDFEFVLDKNENLYLEISDNPFLKKAQLKLFKNENHFTFIYELLIRQIDNSVKQKLKYPVKILMLGNHGSGKSSLVNYITENRLLGSTHILRIENYKFTKEKKILPDAIFYDFGGQDFYHGLYQAFISNDSLQIILFNPKTDKNEISTDNNNIPIINFNRRFWLGQKSYNESGLQVSDSYIMVQSHEDDELQASNFSYTEFEGYKKSFTLCLENNLSEQEKLNKEYYKKGKEYFKAYLDNIICKVQITNEEPKWYIDFLNYVIYKNEDGHEATNYENLLKHYKLKDVSETEKLQSLKTNLINLHRHGLVLYYPYIGELHNTIWLNPQKLVLHIQDNILSKNLLDVEDGFLEGRISKSRFEQIVKDKKLLALLREQKVIFLHNPSNIEKDQEYIIPNYLPLCDKNDSQNSLLIFGFNKPNLVIKFNNFIPFGFINQMICFFGLQPDIKKFWRNQLLFTLQKDIRVLIELDFEALKINIFFQVATNSIENVNYLIEYVYYCILGLYWNFNGNEILTFKNFLNYKSNFENNANLKIEEGFEAWLSLKIEKECIPNDIFISLDNDRFISCKELYEIEEKEFKIKSYSLNNNVIEYNDVKLIPVSSFSLFTPKKISIMKKVFIAYSKFDEDYLQDFEDHLVTLKQEGVATFNCNKIEFGKEWDKEIKKQLDECDIMVCLISVKFLNTDYIRNIEIPKAIELNKIIIPIIIKACDWETSELGKYQAASRGKVVSLDNNAFLLGKINGSSPDEKAAFWTAIVKEFRKKLLLP
jgi:internalin A